MTKPPKIIRPTKLTLALPEDVRAKLDLHLFSEVEHRVPFGAYQRFFIERIREFFNPKPQPTWEDIKLWHFENVSILVNLETLEALEAWEEYRKWKFK